LDALAVDQSPSEVMNVHFTEAQLTTIAHALRVAARLYDDNVVALDSDAASIAHVPPEHRKTLADSFRLQRSDATKLAEIFEAMP
jgi:hypothetical protein